MFLGETGATGIRWIVNQDSLGVWFDLGLEVVEVNLPFLFGDQVVVVEFHA